MKHLTRKVFHIIKYLCQDGLQSDLDFYSLSGMYYKKKIFIHIPKTGGVTVNKYLYNSLGGGHHTFKFYENHFGNNLDKYHLFTIVRDPIDRYISALNFLLNDGYNGQEFNLTKRINPQGNFDVNEFTQKNLLNCLDMHHFMTQQSFIINQIGEIDKRIKLYEYKTFFKIFNQKMISKTIKHNANPYRHLMVSDLKSDSLAVLKTIYHKDILLYNGIEKSKDLPF